jgi:hypothetical protein
MTMLETREYQLRVWGAPRTANYADRFVEALEQLGPAGAHLAAYDSPEVAVARARRRVLRAQLRVLREFHRSTYGRRR